MRSVRVSDEFACRAGMFRAMNTSGASRGLSTFAVPFGFTATDVTHQNCVYHFKIFVIHVDV